MHNLALHPPRRRSGRPTQTGAMLLEVLVAILIFSFGVLALVGLQGSMTRAQTEAELRAEASFLANEALGIMWGDVNNLPAFNSATCSTHDPCATWQGKIADRLPAGRGVISILPAAGNQGRMAEITVTWRHSNGDQRTHRTFSQISPAG